jgi:carbon monoxide dehydrogenase subunit G
VYTQCQHAIEVPPSARCKLPDRLQDFREGEGFAKGGAKVDLVERDGGALLSYHVDARIGSKLAQSGQRLINGTARKMADEFFTHFARAL